MSRRLLLLALVAASAFAAPLMTEETGCINDGKKVPCEKKQIDEELPNKVEWNLYDKKRMEPCAEEIQQDTGCPYLEESIATTSVPTLAPVAETTTAAAPVVLKNVCENGEIRYKDSCYYFDRISQVTMKEAEHKCFERNSTLFVANDMDEYKNVIEANAPKNAFTWIGLYKKDETSAPSFNMEGMDYKELNWLVKTDKNSINSNNGWNSAAQCAAAFNPDAGKYDFYYPCTYNFHYVCERSLMIASDKPKRFF